MLACAPNIHVGDGVWHSPGRARSMGMIATSNSWRRYLWDIVEKKMADLSGVVGEVSMTLKITRKETGLTEEVKLVGFVNEEQLKQLQEAGSIKQEESHAD